MVCGVPHLAVSERLRRDAADPRLTALGQNDVGGVLIALINNGSTLLGLDPTYQQIVQGAIILAAVGLDG